MALGGSSPDGDHAIHHWQGGGGGDWLRTWSIYACIEFPIKVRF